jgi:cation transport ATPase
MKKEEIIRQLEERGVSEEILDKIKNATTEEEARDIAWKQLGWFERMWGRAFWWIVLTLVSLLVWLIWWVVRLISQMSWIWIIAIIAALVVVVLVSPILWRVILATWIALISTHAQREGELMSFEMDRLRAQGFTGNELLAEMRRKFPIPRRRPWYVELYALFIGR